MKPRCMLLAIAACVAGCSLEPDYERPEAPVAASYPTGPAYQSGASTAPPVEQLGWRDFFTDPRLQQLIELTLANNRDLRVAAANVAAAEAQYRLQRSDLLPHINANAIEQASRGGGSAFSAAGASAVAPVTTGGSTTGSTTTGGTGGSAAGLGRGVTRFYDVGVGFTSYELDLFGRLRSLSHEAFERYLAEAENRRNVQISLVAQVAGAYLALLADQNLLRLTQNTLASQEESLRLTEASFRADVTNLLSVRQAQSTVETARANLAQYTRQVAQDQNLLTFLVGQPIPGDLPRGKDLDQQGLLADLPAGLPSELLERRPDIIAAEHALIAANADIGAARANFFPRISLTGSVGTASTSLSGLFKAGSGAWSFAPSVVLPIFDFGANVATLDISQAQRDAAVAQYERAIQNAFREVADALAARGTLDQQIRAQQALVDALADAYRLSDMRFRAGIDNYLTTLDAQRSLYAAQQVLIQTRQSRLVNLATLYKALGGGWLDRAAVAAR